MNEQARKIFSELLDVNYEYTKLDEAMDTGEQVDLFEMMSLGSRVADLKQEFKQAMGAAEYQEFMRQGKEMFAPVR